MKLNRRHLLATAAGAALATPGLATTVVPNPPPPATVAPPDLRRVLFDDGWKFAFGHLNDVAKDFGWGADQRTYAKQGPDATPAAKPDFDDSAWRPLNLPHDWAVELPFVPNPKFANPKPDDWDPAANHGFKPLGRDFPETSVGWYRKVFDVPIDGKRTRLEFDGVFRQATVIFNGYVVKQNDGGYTPFNVDLTDFLNSDGKANTLLVRVDASLGEGWFYEGAGIYRHVWLTRTNPIHIPQYGVCVRARTDGTVEVTTTVRNDSDAEPLQFAIYHYLPGQPEVHAILNLSPRASVEDKQVFSIGKPSLWSLENPYLYELQTVIDFSPSVMGSIDFDKHDPERVRTTFGFRDVRFDPDTGFWLNGQNIKLKGTCNHQDHAGVGAAVPDAVWWYRLRCLKEMGCNAVRTSHNPPAPEMLDICDRLGLLVLDETRMMTSSDAGLDQLRTMILRDRNHPSIILWSIGNEEPQQGTDRGAVIARTMKSVCNDLDPTRQITAAMDGGYGDGITSVLDVVGFNYRDNKIDDFHAKFPKIPIIGTETGSTVCTRGEYEQSDAKHIVPAYDTVAPWWANTAEVWWPHFDARPYIGGGFIWTGFDYRGEPTPYSNWPSISSQFGAMDTCGFPKDNYYYYRAWWRPEPLLHLFPHWNWEGKEGQTISVWAHSNCDEIELFVNGKSAGRKAMQKDYHLEWSVPYAPGRIEAFAYKAGKVVLKDKRETAGPAARVILTSDRDWLAADGRDCAVLRAEVVDAKGRTVPRADNLVRFDILGNAQVIGVGNGNPNSHEPDKASSRMAFNGLCQAIVQGGKGSGMVTVTASADGLAAGKVVLKAG